MKWQCLTANIPTMKSSRSSTFSTAYADETTLSSISCIDLAFPTSRSGRSARSRRSVRNILASLPRKMTPSSETALITKSSRFHLSSQYPLNDSATILTAISSPYTTCNDPTNRDESATENEMARHTELERIVTNAGMLLHIEDDVEEEEQLGLLRVRLD